MQIQLRFFAGVREALGASHESLSLPGQIWTAGDVRRYLCERGGVWSQTLAEGRAIRIACNHVMVEPQFVVTEGSEVAFFPPVTGG